jgi:hypothetical protein
VAKAKMQTLKSAPKEAFFRTKLAKKACFLAKNGGFSVFLFTDKYTWVVDEDVYYVSLALMNPSQEPGFEG